MDIVDQILGSDNSAKGSSLIETGSERFIPIGQRYQKEEGVLEHTLGALDYLNNAGRSALKGAIDPRESAWTNLKQALNKKRYTSADNLRKTLGWGNVGKDDGKFQLGDIADFASNFAVDVATDPLTYLTAGLSSLGKLGKGAELAKQVAKGGKYTPDVISEASKVAKAADNIQNVATPAIGALYGVGASDSKDDLKTKLGYALGGAAGAYAGRKAVIPIAKAAVFGDDAETMANPVLKVIKKKYYGDENKQVDGAFASFSNWYGKKFGGTKEVVKKDAKGRVMPVLDEETGAPLAKVDSKGRPIRSKTQPALTPTGKPVMKNGKPVMAIKPQLQTTKAPTVENLDKTYSLAKQAVNDQQRKAFELFQGHMKVLDGLNPAEQYSLFHSLDNLQDEFLNVREYHYDNLLKARGLKKPGEFYTPEHLDALNEASQMASKEVMPKVPEFVDRGNQKLINKVYEWVDNNDRFVENYNKEVYGLEKKGNSLVKVDASKPDPKSQMGFVGIKFHIPDVDYTLTPKDVDDILKGEASEVIGFKKKFAKEETLDVAKNVENQADHLEKRKAALSQYANTQSFKFLDKEKRQALSDFIDYSKRESGDQWILKNYDKVNGFVKQNMLYTSISWLKNNFFDNAAKAYIETGLTGALDAASLGALHKNLSKDMWDLMGNKFARKFNAEHIDDAVRLGVIDAPTMEALNNTELEKFIKGQADKVAEAKGEVAKEPGKLIKIADDAKAKWDMLLQKSTGRLGSYFEAQARMTHYIRTLDAIQKDPFYKALQRKIGDGALEEAKQLAAKSVSKTFFDYADSVGHFENAVIKRIIPFYSFYKNNLRYWVEAGFDPERIGRIANLEKLRHNVGSDVPQSEREGLPEYLAHNGARKLGSDKFGNHYGITPTFSMFDAIEMAVPAKDNLTHQLKEKLNPLIKTPLEIAGNDDYFTGGTLTPSSTRKGEKNLYSRGFKYYPFFKAYQDFVNFMTNSNKRGAVWLDDKGNPKTDSDNLVYLDKVLSTLVPMGFVDQTAGSIGKVAVGKEGPVQSVMNQLLPVKDVAVPNSTLYQIKNARRKDRQKEFAKEREEKLQDLRSKLRDRLSQ